jgi:hypothetical protein
MPIDFSEFTKETLSSDMEDVKTLGASSEAVLADKLGLDSSEVKIDGEGLKINDELITNVDDLTKAVDNLAESDPKIASQIQGALDDPEIHPSKTTVEKAKSEGKKSGQKESLQAAAKASTAAKDDVAKVTDNIAKANPIEWGKIAKYTILAALTGIGANALCSARTGCYATYNGQQTMLDKNITQGNCNFMDATKVINSAVQSPCNSSACPTYIPNTTAKVPPDVKATTALVNTYSATSCNCTTDAGVLSSPNVAVEWIAPDVFDIIGDALNSVGVFVTGIVNGALKLARIIPDTIADIGKIIMYVGIAAGVIAVIAVIAFVAKKISDKNKAKKLQMGIKGGRQKYKQWDKKMKRIRKYTPISHLSLSHAML